MMFFLSRNNKSHSGAYSLTTYLPRRDPQYDNYICDGGVVLGQTDLGTWIYNHGANDIGFNKQLTDDEAEILLRGMRIQHGLTVELGYCQCVNLSTGSVINLVNAPSY